MQLKTYAVVHNFIHCSVGLWVEFLPALK